MSGVLLAALVLTGCSDGEPDKPLGSFQTTIPKSEMEREAPVFAARSGEVSRWSLEISEDEYTLISDMIGEVAERLTLRDGRVVVSDFGAPQGVFVCHDEEGDRLAAPDKGTGVYSYRLEEDLQLILESEECPLRGFLLERTWSRL